MGGRRIPQVPSLPPRLLHPLLLLLLKRNITYRNVTSYVPLAELTMDPPEGIAAGPISEDNFFEWEALIA